MIRTTLLMAVLAQLVASQLIRCEYEGAICVNSDGQQVTGECTKYYALCTERRIQTAPIEVNDPETTSCRDGVIVAASTCSMPSTCTTLGIHCTDVQGTEVADACTSYFRECENGSFTEVMPVAFGSRCLHNAIVLNSACTSASCTFNGIQCTNGAGDFVNTYCTGYFVECVDGQMSAPIAVPAGTSCYLNNLVLTGTCATPACTFTGIRCSDDTGTPVSNTCSSHFIECNDGVLSEAMPVASGTQCYHDAIVSSEVCSSQTCPEGGVIVCSDAMGVLQPDVCTGHYRQCVNGEYGAVEDVPTGTLCKNGEIMMKDVCTTSCMDYEEGVRTHRCTTSTGIPVTGTCTKFYQQCTGGSFDQAVMNMEPGWSCYNGQFINDNQCSSSDYECDFTGIRCSNANGELISSTCSEYYVQCEFGAFTAPRKTAPGTRCFNDEQVIASSCTTACTFDDIKCSDHDGILISNTCTNYFVQCDNGIQTLPTAVAAGSKCLNNTIVRSEVCIAPVCTDNQLICSNEEGVADTTSCTDYYMECDHGFFIEPRPVAYGTKCLKGQLVLASACASAACTFEGVKCSDANGVIYEDLCQSYFVQCTDGVLTAPAPVAEGTRCFNGRQITLAECSHQNCDFTGFKCSDANGVVFSNTCTSYFVECAEASVSQPMPVAAGTRCLAGSIVHANQCEEAACTYENLQCTDADGVVYTDTCTSYFVECDHGKQTAPMPTAAGTRCYNGQQIQATECSAIECAFEGIQCTDANSVSYPDTCTQYFTQCDNGHLSAVQEVPAGTRCLKNELVLTSVCTGALCDYEGIKCSDAYGTLYADTCTSYFVQCDQGVVTAPTAVALGTRCRNGEIIDEMNCPGTECTFTGKKCTDATGTEPSSPASTCTNYYTECINGFITAPTRVSDGSRCRNGEVIEASQCAGTQCENNHIRCVDAEGVEYTNTCTNYYAECDQGVFTPPRPVAAGTRCYNGEQVLASTCPGVTCTTTDIRCSDLNGNAFDNVCTSYYMECDDGQYRTPQPVAPGTYCLAGELVLPFKCMSTQCDFTGIKCTDSTGTVFDTTCTDYFMECDENGQLTNPMLVPAGVKCLAGSLVISSTCPGASCTYSGFRCVTAEGTVMTNTCTSYYMECVNGERSKPLPVATGTRCYNHAFVAESQCVAPQCSFTGVKCTDAQGVAVQGTCSEYYTECQQGVLVGPIKVGEGKKCLNDELVMTTTCTPKECDFTGFICSDEAGTLLADTCTSYFVECMNYQYSKPIPVAVGSSCYNQQIINTDSAQCSTDHTCDFDGIRCADGSGKVIANRCTNYYVMCANGEYTKPRLTADGTKCYNNEQILTSLCDGVQCAFSGIMCVDKVGSFVMNTCTTQYAECDGNAQIIKDVATGTACYNSQIISATDANCKITVEVQENKMKGIRGKR